MDFIKRILQIVKPERMTSNGNTHERNNNINDTTPSQV